MALDYLAQQVGLWLFPALTTRTNRAQYYSVVLYGLWLAEQTLPEHQNTDEMRQRVFERWERFWALSVLEHHGTPLERGDGDTMRGIRGAARHWRSGEGPLPLDYPLISRQSELGGLGAYLSSLRKNSLVLQGSLKPAPGALAIIDNF